MTEDQITSGHYYYAVIEGEAGRTLREAHVVLDHAESILATARRVRRLAFVTWVCAAVMLGLELARSRPAGAGAATVLGLWLGMAIGAVIAVMVVRHRRAA